MQKLVLIFLLLLPNCVQAQEFENVLWWKALDNEAEVVDVAISPDGKYFLSLTEKLQLWDANNGDFILNFELDNYLGYADIYFSNDSKYVYADNEMKEGDFAIWEVATGKIYRRFSFQNDIYDARMSNDGKIIAFIDNYDIISVYDIETQELIASEKQKPVFSSDLWIRGGITFSPDDKYIIFIRSEFGYGNKLHGIDFLDPFTLDELENPGVVTLGEQTSNIEFSRDGKYLFLYTGDGSSYGTMPKAIYTYPVLKEITFNLEFSDLFPTNYYFSPISDEVLIDFSEYEVYDRYFYVLPRKNVDVRNYSKLPKLPFMYLRDSDTSGKKMPGFRARVASIHTKDTMGVFLPPWNTSKVKEKTNNNEDKIYPNPSTNSADIAFALDDAEEIKIMIYDNSGRMVETLHSGLLEAGEHTFSWNCSNVSSGKYICNIRGNSVFKSMQLVVAR